MDTYLAIASKRDTRGYAARPIPEAAVRRILDAGRVAGSAKNRQPWRFLLVEDPAVRERLAETGIEGIAVHIGARIASLAGAGDVLASSTVKDLVVGSGIDFAERGTHVLKGVPGEWHVHAVTDAGPGR